MTENKLQTEEEASASSFVSRSSNTSAGSINVRMIGTNSQLHNPTPAMAKKLELFKKLLKMGNLIDNAIAMSGVPRPAYYFWCRRGEEERKWEEGEQKLLHDRGIDEPVTQGVYSKFLTEIEQCMGEANVRDEDTIRKAAEAGAYPAAVWRLKMRNKKTDWYDEKPSGPTTQVTVNNNTQVNASTQVTVNVAMRMSTLIAQIPELSEFFSLLAEKAEIQDVRIAHALADGSGKEADPGASTLPAQHGHEDGALASGPLGLRRGADEE